MPLAGGGESGLDAAQGRLQVRAEALHDGDDRDRDAGGDETVFDGGCARLFLGKALYEVRHIELHWSTRGCLSVILEPLSSGFSRTAADPIAVPLAAGLISAAKFVDFARLTKVVNRLYI